jgi:hypothetical protein
MPFDGATYDRDQLRLRYPEKPGVSGDVSTRQTSAEASAAYALRAGSDREVIFNLIRSCPSTAAEIDVACAKHRPNQTAARISELKAQGLIRTSGKLKDNPRTGRPQVIWEINPDPSKPERTRANAAVCPHCGGKI